MKQKRDNTQQRLLAFELTSTPPRRLSPHPIQASEELHKKMNAAIQPTSQPFSSDVQEFHKRHSASKATPPIERSPNYFPWPKADIKIGDERPAPPDWRETGLLHHLGYIIEEDDPHRRGILKTIFEQREIPYSIFLISGENGSVKQWGRASSKKRLQKMAIAIANFCFWERQRKPVMAHRKLVAFCGSGKQSKKPKSQDEIEYYRAYYGYITDLAWLKKEFYDRKFDE